MQLNTNYITGAVLALVAVVVLFKLLASLIPEAESAGDTLNESGVPLGALFAGGGVVFVIIMAAVLLVVVKAFMPKK